MAKKATKAKTNGTNGTTTASRSGGVERSRYAQQLPCRIDDAAVATRADELAKVIHEREATRERKREINAKFREKLNFFDERLSELATAVEKHTEQRSVECVELFFAETNEIQVIRTDSGEIVESRAADASDRQEALFDVDEPDLSDEVPLADGGDDLEEASP